MRRQSVDDQLDQLKKERALLRDSNVSIINQQIALQQSQLDLLRENHELKQKLWESNQRIITLESEKMIMQSQLDRYYCSEVYSSSRSLTTGVTSARKYQKKRIFDHRTTLHLSSIQPKEPNDSPELFLDEQKVIVSDVRVQEFSNEKQVIGSESLYEEFFIISVSKEQIMAQQSSASMILEPEILFQHPKSDSQFQDQYKLLPQMIYPYGIQVKLEQKTLSMSNLNQIVMGGHSYDRLNGTYVICMKSSLSFEHQSKRCHIESDSIADFIASTNKSNQLYCICLDVVDFYDHNSNKRSHKQYYYQLSKTYCFVTKAPLINYFIDALNIIIKTLKYKRAEIFSMIQDAEDTLTTIDNTFYMSFKHEIYTFLNQLQDTKSLSNCQHYFLQSVLPQPKSVCDVQNIEIEWCLPYVLSHLSIVHYMLLLIASLLETNICIISSNKTILSSILMLLPHLIKPFESLHPIIFSLTQQLLPMLDSPVPFFCAIYRDKDSNLEQLGIYNEEEFYQQAQQVVFFDADKLKFYNLPNYTDSTFYASLLYELFQPFDDLNSLITPGHYIQDNSEQNLQICIRILNITKAYIVNNIILNTQNQDEIAQKVYNTQNYHYYRQTNP